MTKLINSTAVSLLTLGVSSTQADMGFKESSMKQFTELKEAEWKGDGREWCKRNGLHRRTGGV